MTAYVIITGIIVKGKRKYDYDILKISIILSIGGLKISK
jgi:hypothetical protein